MKKVVIIWSSPNTDGLTASAKNMFVSGLADRGIQAEEIHLNAMKIEHCRACGDGWGTCRDDGTCIIQDDYASIYQKLEEADGIVFISAVYWQETTECFKAFFDRLRRNHAIHNRTLADKNALLIACAGGSGRGVVECLMMMERGMNHLGMKTYDRIPVVRFNKDYMLPALKGAGAAFADCVENGFQ